jgi:hypothetical protein
VQWLAAQQKERGMIAKQAQPAPLTPPPPLEAVRPVTPGEYLDVAQRDLFARDRNPEVVIEVAPPPPPPPQKPLPPLPVYHGQMSLGKAVVLLSLKGDDQKSYEAGEEVGPFKLLAFDAETITLEFEGKTVERKLAELRPKEPLPQQAAAAAPVPPPPSASATVRTLGSSADPNKPASSSDNQPGADIGGGFRACAPGDTSPDGTLSGGYRKVVTRGLMGSACRWEQVK